MESVRSVSKSSTEVVVSYMQTVFTPSTPTRLNSTVELSRVGVGGVYWALDSITGIDITVPTTMVAPLGSIINLSWIRIPLVILCTFGVLFNGFVLFVLLYGKQCRRDSSKVFIINQTVADLLDCLSIIINAVMATYKREYMKLPGAVVLCIMFESSLIISICSHASLVGLVILTLERYFKIVYPIKYRQKFRPWMNWVGVALPWMEGIVLGVPLIAATTGFDRQKGLCRALVSFTSPAARKVSTKSFFFRNLGN